MGYTHYATVTDAAAFAAAMPQIAADARKIIGAVEVPVAGWDGTGAAEITDTEIRLNGLAPEDYETFALTTESGSSFCKTGRRPYDVIVTAILLRAFVHAPSAIEVESDGDMDGEDWTPAHRVVEALFG